MSCNTLKDTSGSDHLLHIQDNRLFLDRHPVLMVQTADQIHFVLDDGQVIICTSEACWQAIAGEHATPTMQEIGQLLAEKLAYWCAYQRLRALVQGFSAVLDPLPAKLSLPLPRLDPFIETVLAHCEPAPTIEKVMALAQVIDQPLPLVLDWLAQRGKTACSSPPAASSEEEEPAANTESLLSLAPSASKRSQFQWSAEMIGQLTEAFLAAPIEQSVRATAKTIAERYGWPAAGVEYKLYHLNLPEQRAQRLQPETTGADDLREPEDHTLADQPEEPDRKTSLVEPTRLLRGNYVWDVHIDGALQRWYLDYPYGSFPSQPGEEVCYDNRSYTLLVVGASTVKAISARQIVAPETIIMETAGGQR